MEIKLKFSKLNIDENKYKNYKFKPLDYQLKALPDEISFCKKCVISNQRPRNDFDEGGVCNACRYAEKKFEGEIDWKKREEELIALLDKYRSKDGSWDIVVPGSGGKDSALVTHQLKHRYGMHPLAITWAPFIYTDIGWQNYYNFIQAGFDGLVAWPNGILHRKLARVAFELKGDAFEPFVHGQKAYGFHVACKFKIPIIMYGENGELEYGGSIKNWDKPWEPPEEWVLYNYKGTSVDMLLKEGVEMGILTEEEMNNNTFQFYNPPPKEEIEKVGVRMYWWSYYKPWIPQEHFYYATKNTGFEPDTERTESSYTKANSIDDRLDGFHYYLAYIKFGYGRASRAATSDIRCGHITREEGVALAQRYDHEFPKKYFKDFLNYLDITEEHFWKIIDKYRSPRIWKKENGKWKRRKIVSDKSVYGEEPIGHE